MNRRVRTGPRPGGAAADGHRTRLQPLPRAAARAVPAWHSVIAAACRRHALDIAIVVSTGLFLTATAVAGLIMIRGA